MPNHTGRLTDAPRNECEITDVQIKTTTEREKKKTNKGSQREHRLEEQVCKGALVFIKADSVNALVKRFVDEPRPRQKDTTAAARKSGSEDVTTAAMYTSLSMLSRLAS